MAVKKTSSKTASSDVPQKARANAAIKKSVRKGPKSKAAASSESQPETSSSTAEPGSADAVVPVRIRKPRSPKADKLSALDAAAKVLGEVNESMTTRQLIEAMAAKGYWTSPGGQTPQATLYSAILRELATKGDKARFKKTERGKFALA